MQGARKHYQIIILLLVSINRVPYNAMVLLPITLKITMKNLNNRIFKLHILHINTKTKKWKSWGTG